MPRHNLGIYPHYPMIRWVQVSCPVDCIHSDDESPQFYIDPDVCIGCGACEPECPVGAIFVEDKVPTQWEHFIGVNADYYSRARGGYPND